MAIGVRSDPYLAFNFLVEIDGLAVGGFDEVTGLQAEVEVFDYREGGQNEFVHRLAGPVRYPASLVLRRGLTAADTFVSWFEEVARELVTRRSGAIVLLDAAVGHAWRWNFYGAYPIRWT